MPGRLGGTLTAIGLLVGGLMWVLTTAHFFATGNGFLGVVSLLLPPSEVVLPWLVSPNWGLVSLASIVMLMVGAGMSSRSDR
jgi:hypothetical protein